MNATYWQKGETIDYKNTGNDTIPLNSVVVLGERIGIAGDVIPPEATRAVHVTGVFVMPKDNSAIDLGKGVYYDKVKDIITAAGTTSVGWAVEAAAATDTEVKVKIG